jgi:hypothetical protein
MERRADARAPPLPEGSTRVPYDEPVPAGEG